MAQPQSTDTGVWYLCGMAHEWTAYSEPYGGYGRVKRFRGLYALTKVISEWQIEGFDYLEVGARYDANYQGPQSFQGFSGGGLWQLLIVQDHASGPRIVDRILSGVAFYQSALEGEIRRLTCHGRRSIYGPTIDIIREISVS
ncbi:MAG: hypothetical protein HY882_02505 [Deltaproteobacteria bacterium]|nr:hypothetical protein [Deltaproteobacteria bacterium]